MPTMRNTLPTLSRAQAAGSSAPQATPPQPTIRLISATPSASGSTIDPNLSVASVAPFASSPLAPRDRDTEAPRKRLVPKKSKLALLGGGGSNKAKDKANKDFSDVVRRVGANTNSGSTTGKGFEIYVDHADDSELGEIVVVKKKKSRLGLDGMGWGALGEVTNMPASSAPAPPAKTKPAPSDNLLKVKTDENQKWWSIGRGRKDSKQKAAEKEQEIPSRSKTPEPLKPVETRARFNSLGSTLLLSAGDPKGSVRSTHTAVLEAPAQANNNLLAPPSNASTNNGSIALRAMRSMRSIARMKSWATLSGATKEGNNGANDAISTNATNNTTGTTIPNDHTTATKEDKKTKKKSKKEKEKEKEKEKKDKTIRNSGSSFEAGALSAQASPMPPKSKETMKKKQSVLGLGLPSTLRLGTVRNISSSSSNASAPRSAAPVTMGRLSVDSAHLMNGVTGRPSSVLSSGSSLRPPSTASGISAFSGRSARSSTSSVVSVRWDEEGLQHAKEMQRKERRAKRDSATSSTSNNGAAAAGTRRTSRESRRSSEARRRTPISEIFPGAMGETQATRPSSVVSSTSGTSSTRMGPVVNVEEATADGHEPIPEEFVLETPVKRARPRPVSEQLLGKTRPQGIHEEGDGVMSILDAATNDLASLINRLDLEATPASSNGSPMKRSPLRMLDSPSRFNAFDESPIKMRTVRGGHSLARGSIASIGSLRQYALSQQKQQGRIMPAPISVERANLIGQQIVPWDELDWKISPKKFSARPSAEAFRPTHKRTLTPLPSDPPQVFQPLPPAKRKVSPALVSPSAESTSTSGTPLVAQVAQPSSRTFGSDSQKASKVGVEASDVVDYDEPAAPSPTPAAKAKRASGGTGHIRSGSLVSAIGRKESKFSIRDANLFIDPEARHSLAMSGTLGEVEENASPLDPEDPDSDVPDELHEILGAKGDEEFIRHFEDTISFRIGASAPASPVGEPDSLPVSVSAGEVDIDHDSLEVPVFRAQLIDDQANHADIDDIDMDADNGFSSEDDTKKSFDFTGELQKLNESGGSDRRSFVEQLENAFRTPARIELGFDDGLLKVTAPPLPPLPAQFRAPPSEDVAPRSVSDPEITTTLEDDSIMDPSYRNSAVSTATLEHLLAECEEDMCLPLPDMRRNKSSVSSKASDGQLDVNFKFGGKPSVPPPLPENENEEQMKPLTLSDIIPPPTHHYRSHSASASLEEDSVMRSILAQAVDLEGPAIRERCNSDTSSRRFMKENSQISATSSHSRATSTASFTGFESFDEVRRGFEFPPDRPAFYPPAGANNSNSRISHRKFESFYSIASVSSYGAVLNYGSSDPFGYISTRPISDDMSMSMSVDDTFSFIRRDVRRQRVDSDASSFYFRAAPGMSSQGSNIRRSHRRGESNMSVVSNAPPVSIYNKSFGAHHRRNDSSGSMGSYVNRSSWARHRHDPSVDSIGSEIDAMRLARPGIGDKMFERDYGMPLTAISASPPESMRSGSGSDYRSSYDSIMDDTRNVYPNHTVATDSIFEQTGYRNSYSSDESVFGNDGSSHIDPETFMRRNRYRPISMMSVASSHSAPREDDTMITMIGGGHVRRRSVDSLIEASPCVKMGMEKRKQTLQNVGRVLRFDDIPEPVPPIPEEKDTPAKVTRLLEKPSIASTSSYQFGGERMIKARQGLLERQSLEDSALIAQGDEILESLRSTRVFSRPGPASRSRSSTVTTASSSGAETPPLSSSDGSSVSGGSESSIDVNHLNTLLIGCTRPASGIAGSRARARARGAGHRRRISQAHMSRSSVYETIHEESYVFSSSPSPAKPSVPTSVTKEITSSIQHDSVYIVDSDTQSLAGSEDWNDERGIIGLRQYFALRDEAHETVTESKRIWLDTPFSLFALQSFEPPRDRGGMQAMLEHSQKNYGPLPSELRPRRIRSRTSSRASPYPLRSLKSTVSPDHLRSTKTSSAFDEHSASKPFALPSDLSMFAPLKDVSMNTNANALSPPPAVDVKPFSPFAVKLDQSFNIPVPPVPNVPAEKNNVSLPVRPRVTSSVRRTALGWSKRSTGKSSSSDQKENVSQGTLMTPGESLRISRPRPRGRPTPARAAARV
ncbi:hypothetical protein K474DRAFT_1077009 [Panus rudis PR-1116 ss-1]|nr:hypothetical protein K474DRAFT_1077009 [Panus rudis PR-1116 ss-1]